MKRTPLRRKTPIARGTSELRRTTLTRKTPVKKINMARVEKRRKAYAARLRRADWKLLKYQAWERSGGLCECEVCAHIRKMGYAMGWAIKKPDGAFVLEHVDRAATEANTPVEVWFTKGGGAPHLRFRGGSVHHVTYARMGNEKLDDLRFMHKHHHAAVEAQHGTRRRYLSGK